MNLITLDFETYFDKEVGFAKQTTEAYVRDPFFEVILFGWKEGNGPTQWFSGTMNEVRDKLLSLRIDKKILVCHNAAFDGFVLSHHFGIVPRMYFDTLSMARPKHSMVIGCALATLTKHYDLGAKGNDTLWAKGMRRKDFTPEQLQQYAAYCMNDVDLTYKLLSRLMVDFPTSELRVIDLLIRMFTQPIIELDKQQLQTYLEALQAEKAETLARIAEVADKSVLMSNPKFADILSELGVAPPTKISPTTQKATYAFSKKDPDFLALLDHPDKRVQAVVSARLGVKSTIEETRTGSLLAIAERGTLPILLNYYGGHTGRASGGDKVNLQNLRRKGVLRKCLKAPKGKMFVTADSSQIEARVLAWLADEVALVEAFRLKKDIYSEFASEIYGKEIIKDRDNDERFVGKTCILGLGYGMSAPKLQNTLLTSEKTIHMDIGQCADAVRLYRSKYPRIPRLWAQGHVALASIVADREFHFGSKGLLFTSSQGVHLPNGMLVRYPGLFATDAVSTGGFLYAGSPSEQVEWTKMMLGQEWNAKKLTNIYGGKVVENVVQALARIIVFQQMLDIAKMYRVCLTVHDEVVLVVDEDEVDDAVRDIGEVMSQPPLWGLDLPVACEVHYGRTYGDTK